MRVKILLALLQTSTNLAHTDIDIIVTIGMQALKLSLQMMKTQPSLNTIMLRSSKIMMRTTWFHLAFLNPKSRSLSCRNRLKRRLRRLTILSRIRRIAIQTLMMIMTSKTLGLTKTTGSSLATRLLRMVVVSIFVKINSLSMQRATCMALVIVDVGGMRFRSIISVLTILILKRWTIWKMN